MIWISSLALALLALPFVSAIPDKLNIIGKLTNPAGTYLEGNYNFSFRIYDSYTGGTKLFELNTNVTTDNVGVYDVILENMDLNFSDQYYLEIAVWNDIEMSPRVNLTSSPYAFRANVSDTLNELNAYTVTSLNVTGLGANVTFDSETLFIDVENNRVGIGTASPAYRLQVDDQSADGMSANISNVLFVNQSSGFAGIGTTRPSVELQIHTPSGSNPTLRLSDGDVAHGMTISFPTDTFLNLGVISGTAGGSAIDALSDDDATAMWLRGTIGSSDPTDSIAAVAIIGQKADGTATQALDDNETVLQIRNTLSTNLVTFLGGGDVGIGTVTPNARLVVIGGVNITGGLNLTGDLKIVGDLNLTGMLNATTIYQGRNLVIDEASLDNGTIIRDLNTTWVTSIGSLWNTENITVILDNGTFIRSYNTSWVVAIESLWNKENVTVMLDNGTFIRSYNTSWVTSIGSLFTIENITGAELNLTTLNVTGQAIFTSGNVGIGTPAPTALLDVEGTINATELNTTAITLGGVRRTTWPTSTTVGDKVNYTELNVTGLTLFTGGNVGIGKLSPNFMLDVEGTINATELNITDGITLGGERRTTWPTGGAGIGIWVNGTAFSSINTSYTQSVNLSDTLFVNASSGKVGINTTEPSSTLHVEGTMNVTKDSSSLIVAENGDIIIHLE